MDIVDFQVYRDGGTIRIKTSDGATYFIGNKLSKREGKLYSKYPSYEDADNFLIDDPEDLLLRDIVTALSKYKNDFYQMSIDNVLNKYLQKNRENILNKLL